LGVTLSLNRKRYPVEAFFYQPSHEPFDNRSGEAAGGNRKTFTLHCSCPSFRPPFFHRIASHYLRLGIFNSKLGGIPMVKNSRSGILFLAKTGELE
jgi:hypothetical protein